MADNEINTLDSAPAEESLSIEEAELKRLVPGADRYGPGEIQALLIAKGAVVGENVPQSLRGLVPEEVPKGTNVTPSTAVDGQAAQAAKIPDPNIPGN